MAFFKRSPVDPSTVVATMIDAMAAADQPTIERCLDVIESSMGPEEIFRGLRDVVQAMRAKSPRVTAEIVRAELNAVDADAPIRRGVTEIGEPLLVAYNGQDAKAAITKRADLLMGQPNDHWAGVIFELMFAVGRVSQRTVVAAQGS